MGKEESYILNPIDPKTVRMTKFVDGDPKTDSIYTVKAADCQCHQSRRGQCRHMIMFGEWRKRGGGRMRVDYVHGIYETLED